MVWTIGELNVQESALVGALIVDFAIQWVSYFPISLALAVLYQPSKQHLICMLHDNAQILLREYLSSTESTELPESHPLF